MRHRSKKSFNEHYSNLSQEQISTIYTYQKVGYTLLFVRTLDSGEKLAILKSHDEHVTVDNEGNATKGLDIPLRDSD